MVHSGAEQKQGKGVVMELVEGIRGRVVESALGVSCGCRGEGSRRWKPKAGDWLTSCDGPLPRSRKGKALSKLPLIDAVRE